jgi:pimeloyl-ACP methyl ester carboxylesterase
VSRPCILLCPQFTEAEWSIAPRLSKWAEVATFDAPGVGGERLADPDPAAFDRELAVQRGLREIESLGWDSYFVVGDAWGTATAVRVAAARPEQVLGIALGHASADYHSEGERPAVNGEVVAAMSQLLRTDYDSFVRYGLTQFTQGGFDEETAARIVDRFPPMELASRVWEMLVATPEPIAEQLGRLQKPMLLAKHEGCLVFTPEGFDDLASAFPGATSVTVQRSASASEEFAAGLRAFCEAQEASE